MAKPTETKGNVRYCWPPTLRRPPDLRIIYLDLNHWIALAKAYSGHKDGREHRDILDRLLQSVQASEAVYPISFGIYVEMLKIRDHRRRSDLRKVIEHLGRFTVVDRHGEDVTSSARLRYAGGPDEFDRILNEGVLELNREILDGPSPEDEPGFRADGYQPELILNAFEQEASAESQWARLLDEQPRWRRGRLRDAVSAREVAFHINSILWDAATVRGLCGFDDMLQGVPDTRPAFDAMPSFDVSVT